jgi:hypothetical protein
MPPKLLRNFTESIVRSRWSVDILSTKVGRHSVGRDGGQDVPRT